MTKITETNAEKARMNAVAGMLGSLSDRLGNRDTRDALTQEASGWGVSAGSALLFSDSAPVRAIARMMAPQTTDTITAVQAAQKAATATNKSWSFSPW